MAAWNPVSESRVLLTPGVRSSHAFAKNVFSCRPKSSSRIFNFKMTAIRKLSQLEIANGFGQTQNFGIILNANSF